MINDSRKPLIVQSDRTIFLEVDHPDFENIRNRLMEFAELEKSPEHVHIYRITPISLWNAAAAGSVAEEILEFLNETSRYPVPSSIRKEIEDRLSQFGMILCGSANCRARISDTILLSKRNCRTNTINAVDIWFFHAFKKLPRTNTFEITSRIFRTI